MEHQDPNNFQVDLRGVLDLLSEHLYSSRDVFVRELLQNAVDAITARRAVEPGHEGRIVFEPDPSTRTLTVVDDGIGLERDEAVQFLARVGASIKRGGPAQGDFLGQFGVGLLSCFGVADEVLVLSRKVGSDAPGVAWKGRADGTWSVEPIGRELEPGTRVVLQLSGSAARYARPDAVCELVARYGEYLNVEVEVGDHCVVWPEQGPFDLDPSDPEQKQHLLRAFRWDGYGDAVDVVALRAPEIGLRGVAYVVPQQQANEREQRHKVYLRRMFVTDRPGELLPSWAGFTYCVLDSAQLRPTASREGFYEDSGFLAVRQAVSDALRAYLSRLARKDRELLARLLEDQDQPFRELAREDDEFFDAVIDLLPFETSLGRMTFGTFRQEHLVVRVCPTVDQFRSVATLAAARRAIVFNGGFTHHEELLEKAVARDRSLSLEAVDGRAYAEQLDPASAAGRRAFERLEGPLCDALEPLGVRARLVGFEPADVPAVYAEGVDANLARSYRASREISRGVWSELLEAMAGHIDPDDEMALLCLNERSPVVARLLEAGDRELVAETAKLLYVQALLVSQQPLTSDETDAFGAALGAILGRALGGHGPGAPQDRGPGAGKGDR